MHDYLNKTVRKILDYCVENKIEKVLVGDGKGWKPEVDLGDKATQNFVHIPFDIFKQKLKHKLELHEIEFKLVPESHTSKCSFLDDEEIQHHEDYIGSRVERGLFKASDGTLINGDVNGACNIAKRGIGKPNSELFSSEDGLERVVDTPRRISRTSSTVSEGAFAES
ncbi:MAG: IS200/IS605 family accessory protein TnpB-related protein [Halobacteria archaeon]